MSNRYFTCPEENFGERKDKKEVFCILSDNFPELEQALTCRIAKTAIYLTGTTICMKIEKIRALRRLESTIYRLERKQFGRFVRTDFYVSGTAVQDKEFLTKTESIVKK